MVCPRKWTHFSGNVELISVITEEVLVSLAAVDCEVGCMSGLIDRSYLSRAVEKVWEKGRIAGHDTYGFRGVWYEAWYGANRRPFRIALTPLCEKEWVVGRHFRIKRYCLKNRLLNAVVTSSRKSTTEWACSSGWRRSFALLRPDRWILKKQ